MDFVVYGVILLGFFGFLFLLFKPKGEPKSKEQKQAEIQKHYEKLLKAELSQIDDATARQKRKIALLKTFAKELEFNLFFDEHEVKALIQHLATY